MPRPQVFVFGSNRLGIHGAGAARDAREHYGAQPGIGAGRTGMAYAIPTKARPTSDRRQLPLSEIAESVAQFLKYAEAAPRDRVLGHSGRLRAGGLRLGH